MLKPLKLLTAEQRKCYNRGVIAGAEVAKHMLEQSWDKTYTFDQELLRRTENVIVYERATC